MIFVLIPALAALAFLLGSVTARNAERRRCERLCEQSFSEQYLSATARRIYRSILDGSERLISADEFFGNEEGKAGK